jgi:hypothetical protein
VRCSGYRHSWTSLFSADGEILVSLLSLDQVTVLPDASSILPITANTNELKTIELASQSARGTPNKRLVRVGAAVTCEEFRRWAVANNAWALPVDVILVESVFSPAPPSLPLPLVGQCNSPYSQSHDWRSHCPHVPWRRPPT